MKKWIGIIVIILGFFGVVIIGVLGMNSKGPQQPKPINGVLDLSHWSFEDKGIVRLDGEWSFYYNQFLTHEDFENGLEKSPTPITVPSTKRSVAINKGIPENKFYGTMRLIVKLPDQYQVYGLRSDIVLTSFKLYVDGTYYGEAGKVGEDKENSKPEYTTMYSYISPQSNEIEIIYQTSDFYVGDCAIVVPKLGLARQISGVAQRGLGLDMFLFGMLLIMGIYHMVLYAMRRHDKAPLYYGIFCLSFSLRMLLVGERYLPNTFGFDFFVFARMAYSCVFIGFSALCGFLYYALEGLFFKWFIRICIVTGILFTALTVILPFSLYDRLLIVYAIFGISAMGYIIVRLVQGVWKAVPFTNIVLIGFVCLGVTFINDLIYQVTLANRASLIPIGVCLFTLTQTYTLSARFSSAFTKVEHLSLENETILSRLKDVNSNLESMVEARTTDLQNALEEMDIMSKTDYLTKLPNRRLMVQEMEQLIAKQESFFIAVLDIDHFKVINDTYGHDKGDEVLKRLSDILISSVGENGVVGRWGGEEFLMVLLSDQSKTILKRANEIRKNVEKYVIDELGASITVTIGLCPYSPNNSLNTCIANADKALYLGKVNGRNQCQLFNMKMNRSKRKAVSE